MKNSSGGRLYVTAMFTITSSGKKLPVILIGKDRAKLKNPEPRQIIVIHNSKGWFS